MLSIPDPAIGILETFTEAVLDDCVGRCDADARCGAFNFFNNGRCEILSYRVSMEPNCNIYTSGLFLY